MFSRILSLSLLGALAATLCDLNHVYTKTLSYPHPTWLGQPWWVFFLFTISFIVMILSYRVYSILMPQTTSRHSRSIAIDSLAFIESLTLFVLVYLMTGFANNFSLLLSVILYGTFIFRMFFTYDRIFIFVFACALGISGMFIEGTLSYFGLVAYQNPHIYFVPAWLGAVYMHGALCVREGMRWLVLGSRTTR